jgi:hypothetical protein
LKSPLVALILPRKIREVGELVKVRGSGNGKGTAKDQATTNSRKVKDPDQPFEAQDAADAAAREVTSLDGEINK